MKLNHYIDHTLLKPEASPQAIIKLCQEAIDYEFYAVCVSGCYAYLAAEQIRQSNVKLAVTVGFPLGSLTSEAKVQEAKIAIKQGADEIDMVMNIGFLKAGLTEEVEEEIRSVKSVIGEKILKVILETCYLSNSEIVKACMISEKAGADFVKTSTGFGTAGASIEHIKLMKQSIGGNMKIKASGGIRDIETALEYVNAGADRIGTSSGIQIVSGSWIS
ncbi:deoxyribose-phosphate aldolase [uncultured Christiangramia sp.]|uniref:deoxyribose-phosphate aldolase n=1 Tax=uncultured Christiangramia sp. TaxID=503836 RepID=UPI0025F627D2|nr:deoxyribose-phosphate aldolase [uncultured Christiangramia sp.]